MNTTTRMSGVLGSTVAAIMLLAACYDSASGDQGASKGDNGAGSHKPDTGPVGTAPDTDSSVPQTGSNVPDTGAPNSDPNQPDGSEEQACNRANEAFESFVAAHNSCEHDSDCAIIGDCGPNADFRSLNGDAATQGYALMQARCYGAYDGPVPNPSCVAGRCDSDFANPDGCCGCPYEEDAGR